MRIERLGGSGFRIETAAGMALFDPPRAEPAAVILLTGSELPAWLSSVRPPTVLLGPPALRSAAAVRGVQLEPIDVGGEWAGAFGRVRACETVHQGDRGLGFLVTSDGTCVFHAGRSGITHEMSWLGDLYRIDGALLPIEGRTTMGPREAARAAAWLSPHWVIGWDPGCGSPDERAERELSEHLEQCSAARHVRLGCGEVFEWPPPATGEG